MTKSKLFYLGVVGVFIWMISGFVIPVAMGGMCAVVIYPAFQFLCKRGWSKGWAAVALSLVISIAFLIPVSILGYFGAKGGLQQVKEWTSQSDWTQHLVDGIEVKLRYWFPFFKPEWFDGVSQLAQSAGVKFAELLGKGVAQLPGASVALGIAVLGFYFFLLDGEQLHRWVIKHSFLGDGPTEEMIQSFLNVCRSVLLASVISGAFQSVLYTGVAVFCGVSQFAILGLAVFLLSFLPIVGSAPLTLGLALKLVFLDDEWVSGWILFGTGVLVSLVDNIVRPWVLKGASNFHPMLAFVATLGGIQVFGVSGIFLGPICAGLFMSAIQQLGAEDNYGKSIQ